MRIALIIIILTFFSCAKESRPTGGPIDKTPPSILKISPPDSSLNYISNKITLSFDEYVVLDKAQSQILFSPPLKHGFKTKIKGKQITIQILDTLQKNTTYNLSLRKSIKDNTEGNYLENKSITFSTGKYFDSLKILGSIQNNQDYKNLVACLFDSTNSSYYKSIPFYVTPVNNNSFTFNSLKKSPLKLLVFNDKNNNLLPDKEESIGFLSNLITPKSIDSSLKNLNLYKPITNKQVKFKSSFLVNKNTLFIKSKQINTEQKIQIVSNNEQIKHKYFSTNDSNIFILEKEVNSDTVLLIINDFDSTYIPSGLKPINYDVKKIINRKQNLLFLQYNKLFTSYKIKIFQDSFNSIPTTIKKDSFQNSIIFDLKPFKNKILIVIDDIQFIDSTTIPKKDTITFIVKNIENNFGKLIIKNKTKFQLIYLINNLGNTFSPTKIINNLSYFQEIPAGKYSIKTLLDADNNGVFTPGDLYRNIQPETIKIIKKSIEIREGWEIEMDMDKL